MKKQLNQYALIVVILGLIVSCNSSKEKKEGSEPSEVAELSNSNEDLPEVTNGESMLHEKYMDNIVLSYSPIVYGREKEKQLLNEVVIDSRDKGLYFMFYLDATNGDYLKNQWGKKSQYLKAQLQFDGDVGRPMSTGCTVLLYEKAYDLSDKEEQQTYLSLPIFPSNKYYERDKWLDPTYHRFLRCLTALSLDETHKARVLFAFSGSSKKLEKRFDLKITKKGREGLLKVLDLINRENLEDVLLGKPGAMHNSENVKIVESAAKKNGYKVKKVVITGDRYSVYKSSKYPYEIRNKACNAELTYEEDGKCYLRTFQIVKEYQGGGTYGAPFVPFKWGEKEEMLCKNAKK